MKTVIEIDATLLISRRSQIIHNNSHLVLSLQELASCVQVYDSFFCTTNIDTRNLCAKLFGAEKGIEMQACTQQQGSVDCGVHAIAVCAALTHFFSRVII